MYSDHDIHMNLVGEDHDYYIWNSTPIELVNARQQHEQYLIYLGLNEQEYLIMKKQVIANVKKGCFLTLTLGITIGLLAEMLRSYIHDLD